MGVISRNSSVSLPNLGFRTGEFSVEAVRPSAICPIKNREDSPLTYLSVRREVKFVGGTEDLLFLSLLRCQLGT